MKQKWMKRMWILLFAGLLGGGCALAQSADQGPGYQDTVNWILSKVDQLGVRDGSWKADYSNWNLQNCTIQFDIDRKSNVATSHGHITAPLNADVKFGFQQEQAVGRWSVTILSKTESIREQRTNEEAGTGELSSVDRNTNNYFLDVNMPNSDHADLAPRMAKALNYLAQLCEAPTNNEPF